MYLGESCLNVSAGVTSGQVISWYRPDRKPGTSTPDAIRPVHDPQNFFVNPEDFLCYEGNWYVGTTDKVAFVVKVATLDTIFGDTCSTTSGPSDRDIPSQITSLKLSEYSSKIDAGLWEVMNSTNNIDSIRVWVLLEEPPETNKIVVSNLTPSEKPVYREQQREYYLNYTKPVFECVRSKVFGVKYIGQTSPSIEVEAPPSFIKELAQRPDIRKIFLPKTTPRLTYDTGQRRPDETIRVVIYLAEPPGIPPKPDGYITEKPVAE